MRSYVNIKANYDVTSCFLAKNADELGLEQYLHVTTSAEKVGIRQSHQCSWLTAYEPKTLALGLSILS